jgi:hypothetical protein
MIDPAPSNTDRAFAASAASAVAAVVDVGAEILVREPWRVGRIVRRADEMTIEELADHTARRRLTPPADLNLAIAIAQLSFALASPRFRAAWTKWRNSAGQA